MNWNITVQPVLVCACLAVGLLFDPLGFLRMALFCSILHEIGHILVYRGITGHWPPVKFHVGGISLRKTQLISRKQENWVLLAGPLSNLIFAAALYGYASYRASYGVYFLACVSLCTGIYNLLPIGMLDGARLVQNCFPADCQENVLRVEKVLAIVLVLLTLVGVCLFPLPSTTRMAAFLAASYLCMQQISS